MISVRRGAAAGLLAGLAFALVQALLRLAGVSLPSELVADRVLPHVPVDQFLHLLSLMGGALAAKQQALIGGFVGSAVGGVVMGSVYALILRRPGVARHPVRALSIALASAWVATIALLWPVLPASYVGLPPAWSAAATAAALLLEYGVYVTVLHLSIQQLPTQGAADEGRRRLLLGVAGAVFGLGTTGLAAFLYRSSALGYDGTTYDGPVQALTPTASLYVVTKNLIDPAVFQPLIAFPAGRLRETGRLPVRTAMLIGAAFTAIGFLTIAQTGNMALVIPGVGRGLISNAAWHGVPLRTLLGVASPSEGAVGVTFRAVDGYVHTASLATAMAEGTFLAWLMNGQPLPDRHGYPLRLLVPSAYGEVSVKWLTQIEVVDHAEAGYYETQGWQPRFVQTMSRIDTPKKGQMVRPGSAVELKGIAYAADRGISEVEVSTDGGGSWAPARINYGKPKTWSVWTAVWTPGQSGPATLQVRARDGRGELQVAERRGFAPAGATGLHMVRVLVTP